MPLYLISIGLHDELDMSLRALRLARKCDVLYAEFYTTKMYTDAEKLSKLIEKPVQELGRADLEENSDKIIKEARNKRVGILVGGDCLTATTHLSLLLDAKKLGIRTKVIHGSSIFTAVAETGLSLYKFGRTTTIPFAKPGFMPTSCYDVILANKSLGLHTLVLLDVESGKDKRCMSPSEGMKYLLEIEKRKRRGVISHDKKIVVLAGAGNSSTICYDKVGSLLGKDFPEPAVLIFVGHLNSMEKELLNMFSSKHIEK